MMEAGQKCKITVDSEGCQVPGLVTRGLRESALVEAGYEELSIEVNSSFTLHLINPGTLTNSDVSLTSHGRT
jgi:hypothetical protein